MAVEISASRAEKSFGSSAGAAAPFAAFFEEVGGCGEGAAGRGWREGGVLLGARGGGC
jgi:hypothetical protein